jgi:hypothetical protein
MPGQQSRDFPFVRFSTTGSDREWLFFFSHRNGLEVSSVTSLCDWTMMRFHSFGFNEGPKMTNRLKLWKP